MKGDSNLENSHHSFWEKNKIEKVSGIEKFAITQIAPIQRQLFFIGQWQYT